jgi:hypothetical protein
MVNYPNYLAGSQDDINKRLLQMILELKKSEGADVGALVNKVTALETAVGDKDSGAIKDIADIKTAIGTATAGSETGIHKDIADINTAIGDDDTPASIKGRIYALEEH